jgi:hypothetical protein
MSLDIGLLPRQVQRPFEQLQATVIDTGLLDLQMRFGTATVQVTAATFGELTVEHGLGRTPLNVQLTSLYNVYVPSYQNATDTDFSIRVEHIEAVPQTVPVDVMWLAFG